ncbi:Protein of unknown function, partial [Gryllus bimaculatus]
MDKWSKGCSISRIPCVCWRSGIWRCGVAAGTQSAGLFRDADARGGAVAGRGVRRRLHQLRLPLGLAAHVGRAHGRPRVAHAALEALLAPGAQVVVDGHEERGDGRGRAVQGGRLPARVRAVRRVDAHRRARHLPHQRPREPLPAQGHVGPAHAHAHRVHLADDLQVLPVPHQVARLART